MHSVDRGHNKSSQDVRKRWNGKSKRLCQYYLIWQRLIKDEDYVARRFIAHIEEHFIPVEDKEKAFLYEPWGRLFQGASAALAKAPELTQAFNSWHTSG